MEQNNGSILLDYFENQPHRLIHKWMHCFEIYERHFHPFRGKDMTLLEFGVLHGGSLQMWKHYFGTGAKIYGADINPRCLELAEEQIEILLADQDDRDSIRRIGATLPPFDIIIDDGGHSMSQQVITFEETWNHLKVGGIYLCEDLHTSYYAEFGGGYRLPHTFVEYIKQLIDQLNAWYTRDPRHRVDLLTRTTFGVHFYDSMVVIEKRAMTPPRARMKGTPSFPLTAGEQAAYDRV